jgi:hypothetical protein
MADTSRVTDLTELEGDPSPRAEAEPLIFERIEIRGGFGLGPGANSIEVKASTVPRSDLAMAIVTAILILMGCAVTGVTAAASAPMPLSCAGLLTPTAVYLCLRWIACRMPRRQRTG